LVRLFLGLLAALSIPAFAGECPEPQADLSISVADARAAAWVASTPETRRCGLSHRRELAPNRGMLFVFPRSQPLTFWMKDTRIPLTIAFLDASGRILAMETMDPSHPFRRHQSPEPARYALEMPRGWFRENGIQAGDHCHFQLPPDLPVR
jgi:hypothetical protein